MFPRKPGSKHTPINKTASNGLLFTKCNYQTAAYFGSRPKMKHQQVVPDYTSMLKSSCLCLLLAFSGYVLLKLVQAIFYLPQHLQRNQERLEELAAKYAINLNEEKDKNTDDSSLEKIPEGASEAESEEKKDK